MIDPSIKLLKITYNSVAMLFNSFREHTFDCIRGMMSVAFTTREMFPVKTHTTSRRIIKECPKLNDGCIESMVTGHPLLPAWLPLAAE